MTRTTITTYIVTTIMIITMVVPVSAAQAQTVARTLTPTQVTELTATLTELLTAVKGLQVALAIAPTGQVLGVSIANNAPVIDGEVYTVTGPGEIIRGTEGVDRAIIDIDTIPDRQLRVSAINRWTKLGKELGLSVDQPAYLVYERGGLVQFGTTTVEATYWTMSENRLSYTDFTPVAESALDAAKALGTVVVDIEIIEGTEVDDNFFGREADDYFILNEGDDYVGGAGGNDTVQFLHELNSYTVAEEGDYYRMIGADGSKRITKKISNFVFQDGTFTPEEAIAILNGEVEVTEEVNENAETEVEETTESVEETETEEPAVEEEVVDTTETEAAEIVEDAIAQDVLEAITDTTLADTTPDVAITPAVNDTTTPTPGFTPNSTLTLSANVNVRDPYGLQGRIVGIQPANSQGTIIDITPEEADGYTWIPVDFQSGPDGWVASDFTDYDPTIEVDQDGFTILQLQNPDSTILTFENIAEADLPTEDTQYDYPHGLHDFTLEVEPNSTETVTIYLEAEITTTDKEIRKYNPDTEEYETITDQVTFGTADLADTTVTTLTYDVVDNGPLDDDPRVGFIVDPVGVGEPTGAPDLSGLTDNDHNTHDAGTTLHEEHDVLFNLMPYTDATHIAAQSGAWSDPATWQGNSIPGDDARVIIPEDITVTYATISDARLFTVRVDGSLHFSTTESSQMIVDTLASGVKSEFYIGTESNPVPENVTVDIIIANNGDIDTSWDTELISRGVILHGETKMHGHKKTTHGKVATDPMAGDTSITMQEAPDGWEVGDTIVVAGTRYKAYAFDRSQAQVRWFPPEDEVRTISAISGRTVSFTEPLIHHHDAPRADLKTSVANYTRNITIATEDPDTALIHERGHTMFMHNNDVDVRYAAFHELGRTNKAVSAQDAHTFSSLRSSSNAKGRYSFHIHRAGLGDQENPVIAIGNAVFGSPGWGYVHHDSNAVLHNNASYNTFGAGFVAETGNETGTWTNNIAIAAQGIASGHLKSINRRFEHFDLAVSGDGFWFQGRLIKARNNVAASVNAGFAFFHRDSGGSLKFDAAVSDFPESVGHSSQVGIDDVPILGFSGNETFAAFSGMEVVKNNPFQGHDIHTHFKDFTAWRVRGGAAIEYTAHYIFENFDVTGVDFSSPLDTDFVTPLSSIHGIGISNSTQDVTIINPRIEGFEKGFTATKKNTVSDEMIDFDYTIINPTLIDVDVPYDNFNPEIDKIIEGPLESSSDFSISINQPLTYTEGSPSPITRQVVITGSKNDSVGMIEIPASDDNYNATFGEVLYLLEHDGYRTADGTRYFVTEDYYSDRLTGEIHKFGHIVELDEAINFNGFGIYRNATNGGLIDFDSLPPIADNDTATTDLETDVIINLIHNDSDPDGDSLHVDGIVQPEHGRVFMRGDDSVLYRPDFDFTGQDSFKYWVTDNHGNFTPAYVSIGVDERAEELPEPEVPKIDTTPDPETPKDPTPPENTQQPTPTKGTGATTLTRTPTQDLDNNGTLDRLEARISTLLNKLQSGDRYNTLRLKAALSRIRNFYNRTEQELKDDTGYQYPVGLFEFEAEVDPGSTETVTIYLDQVYNTTDWVYRKYNGTTYIDISDHVTYDTADVDGTSVTTITYDVTDNGPLDTDDRLGFIKDPAGPGVVE